MSIEIAVLGRMLISSFLSRQISTIRSNIHYLLSIKLVLDDSLQRRKQRRTRQRPSRHYWTRRGWKLSCSRLLSLYRKYHLERVSLNGYEFER
jgi:hypothetical protein